MNVLFGLVIPRSNLGERPWERTAHVCGSSKELGKWCSQKAVPMEYDPLKKRIQYSTETGHEELPILDPFTFSDLADTWEGQGDRHNRTLDLSKLPRIAKTDIPQDILDCISFPENDNPIVVLPVVHWNDVEEKNTESFHSSAFSKKVSESKSLYATQILPRLWVGSCPRRMEHIHESLKKHLGITVVITLQELRDIQRNCPVDKSDENNASQMLEDIYVGTGIEMIFLPTRDMSTNPKRQVMAPSAIILSNLLANGHTVYVHCNCGIGRAIGAISSYLVCHKRWYPELTMFFLNMVRPISYCDLEGLRMAKKSFEIKFGSKVTEKAV